MGVGRAGRQAERERFDTGGSLYSDAGDGDELSADFRLRQVAEPVEVEPAGPVLDRLKRIENSSGFDSMKAAGANCFDDLGNVCRYHRPPVAECGAQAAKRSLRITVASVLGKGWVPTSSSRKIGRPLGREVRIEFGEAPDSPLEATDAQARCQEARALILPLPLHLGH